MPLATATSPSFFSGDAMWYKQWNYADWYLDSSIDYTSNYRKTIVEMKEPHEI